MPRFICGIDEAGRGPLAGPLIAAAVVVPEDYEWSFEVRDSKKFTERRREQWAQEFKAHARQVGIHYEITSIEVPHINFGGIGWANREIFRRLVLSNEADEYIVDGNHPLLDIGDKADRAQSVVRADQTYKVVMAASILAKTYRDQIMRELHDKYPQYHWKKNKGYGTSEHIAALKTFGSTPHHRGKFAQTVQDKIYPDRGHRRSGQPLLFLGPGPSVLALTLLSQLL
ncbi:MAG: ribonuclease HII [Anaerolineales bacterium]